MLVTRRLAVHQQHVVVRAIAGDVVEDGLPVVGRAVVRQGYGLPVGEGARDFNFRGIRVARLGGMPPESLAEKMSRVSPFPDRGVVSHVSHVFICASLKMRAKSTLVRPRSATVAFNF